jgi:hypothetical protein
MNGEKAVLYVLQNTSGYNTLVGGSASASRVYYDELEQGSGYPQAQVTLESASPTDTKQNSDFDHDLVQVFHSALSKAESLALATAARTALTAASGTINGLSVSEIRFVDQDSFTEKVLNKKIFTTEQLYRVTINL